MQDATASGVSCHHHSFVDNNLGFAGTPVTKCNVPWQYLDEAPKPSAKSRCARLSVDETEDSPQRLSLDQFFKNFMKTDAVNEKDAGFFLVPPSCCAFPIQRPVEGSSKYCTHCFQASIGVSERNKPRFCLRRRANTATNPFCPIPDHHDYVNRDTKHSATNELLLTPIQSTPSFQVSPTDLPHNEYSLRKKLLFPALT